MDTKSFDSKLLIKWIISIGISLLPLLFPTSEAFTPQVQKFLMVTIFAVAIIALELLDSYAAVMIVSALWILTGSATIEKVFSAWSTSNIVMVISSLVFVNVLQKVGLLNRLGYWIILKSGGTFNRLIWALFFGSIIICTVGFYLTWILGFALGYALYKSLNCEVDDRKAQVIVWTTTIGTILAGVYIYCPITVSLMVGSAGAIVPDFNIEWYQIIFYDLPIFFFSIFLVWLGLKWYARGASSDDDVSESINYFKNELAKLGPINNDEKKCIVLLAGVAIYLFTEVIHGMPTYLAFVIASALCYFPGINIGDESCVKNVGWSNIFVVAMFLGLGTIAASLGLTAMISDAIVPIIAKMGSFWSIVGTTIFGAATNFILSPFAMMGVLPGPIASYCVGAGFDPTAHIMALYLAKDIIFFPYEYPAYLILFSFGMVRMGSMVKMCMIKSVLLIMAIIVLVMPYWKLIGLL